MSVIDEYLANVPPQERTALERIRTIVKTTFPDAQEVISYGMPAFKYKGKYLVGFNAFKDHLSLFPTAWPIEVHKDELKTFKLAKGTIQFTLDNPVPEVTLVKLLRSRSKAITKG